MRGRRTLGVARPHGNPKITLKFRCGANGFNNASSGRMSDAERLVHDALYLPPVTPPPALADQPGCQISNAALRKPSRACHQEKRILGNATRRFSLRAFEQVRVIIP